MLSLEKSMLGLARSRSASSSSPKGVLVLEGDLLRGVTEPAWEGPHTQCLTSQAPQAHSATHPVCALRPLPAAGSQGSEMELGCHGHGQSALAPDEKKGSHTT